MAGTGISLSGIDDKLLACCADLCPAPVPPQVLPVPPIPNDPVLIFIDGAAPPDGGYMVFADLGTGLLIPSTEVQFPELGSTSKSVVPTGTNILHWFSGPISAEPDTLYTVDLCTGTVINKAPKPVQATTWKNMCWDEVGNRLVSYWSSTLWEINPNDGIATEIAVGPWTQDAAQQTAWRNTNAAVIGAGFPVLPPAAGNPIESSSAIACDAAGNFYIAGGPEDNHVFRLDLDTKKSEIVLLWGWDRTAPGGQAAGQGDGTVNGLTYDTNTDTWWASIEGAIWKTDGLDPMGPGFPGDPPEAQNKTQTDFWPPQANTATHWYPTC